MVFNWLHKITRPQTPPTWQVIEVEKPVPVLDRSDDSALESLAKHPGMIALLNRLRLQKAALESQVLSKKFKDLDDVNFLLANISGLRIAELEIRSATKNLEIRRQRPASIQESEQFEKIRSSIESVRPTNVG